jgi:hypothetical protein
MLGVLRVNGGPFLTIGTTWSYLSRIRAEVVVLGELYSSKVAG